MKEGAYGPSLQAKAERQEEYLPIGDMDKFSAESDHRDVDPEDFAKRLQEKYSLAPIHISVLTWRFTTNLTFRDIAKELRLPLKTAYAAYQEAMKIVKAKEGVL